MKIISNLLGLAALMVSVSASAPSAGVVSATEQALVEQVGCDQQPQVARAINAMLRNKLIRYSANESGVYLFKPNAPLKFLGLSIRHISGFDYEAFRGVPASTMAGSAPPVFIEIEVAATASDLEKRALAARLVKANRPDTRGFEISSSAEGYGSHLAAKSRIVTSSIRCVA